MSPQHDHGAPPAPIPCGAAVLEFGRRTLVAAIINMSPDSFAGDGLAGDPGAAEARGHAWREAGADVLDVGGRSTRPGAPPVAVEDELRLTIPAVRRLASVGLPISVDTFSAAVATAALDAGACMINDVTALRGDPAMAPLAARAGVPVVLMDWDDRRDAADVVAETARFLRERMAAAVAQGIEERRLIVDPGYGFGLTLRQNMELLRRLGELRALGRPVLIGTSRKGSIGKVLNLPVHDRLEGTAATVAVAIAHGADIVRVHDVRAMVRVARMTDAIVRGVPETAPPEGPA
ncbi:MAG TPA: dihydropteroate synthase [bacterium]|nr:dihydropteroate synthase [bacterium]